MSRLGVGLMGVIMLLLLGSLSFAQKDEIPRTEYFARFREALAKSGELSRRQVKTLSFLDGRSEAETWTYEYQVPDRIRYLHVRSADGKTWRTEQIDIGKDTYCKKDDGPWVVATKFSCIGAGGRGVSGITGEVFRKQGTSLNGKLATAYSWYITHRNPYSKTADTDGESFSEVKFWIDNKGLIVRSEDRGGLVRNGTSKYEEIETYEYDPNIKIEPPVINQ